MSILNAVQGILGEFRVNSNITVLNSPLGGRPAAPLVGSEVKTDEEDEVAGKNTTSSNGGELLTSTLSIVGHGRHVGRSEVGIGSKVNETEVNDELSNLKPGNPLLPPNLDTTSRLEVVPIHDDVDHEVKSDRNPRLFILVDFQAIMRRGNLQLRCFQRVECSTTMQWRHGDNSEGRLRCVLKYELT